MAAYSMIITAEPPLIEVMAKNKTISYRNMSVIEPSPIIEGVRQIKTISYRNMAIPMEEVLVEGIGKFKSVNYRNMAIPMEEVLVEGIGKFKSVNYRSMAFPVERGNISTLPVLLFPEFITLPASINIGEDNLFLLDKDKLAEQDPITKSAFFSDQNNWKKVILLYKSSTGSYKTITFDTSKSTPDGVFNPSITDDVNWELIGATIYGEDPQNNISLDRTYLKNYNYDFGTT